MKLIVRERFLKSTPFGHKIVKHNSILSPRYALHFEIYIFFTIKAKGYLHGTSKFGQTTRILCQPTQNMSDDKN
jgi:hypothetical protein